MELQINKIVQLKSLRVEKSELSEKERELTKPILTDTNLIKPLYEAFSAVLSERTCAPCIDSVIQRKKFLFIIMYLYSPSTLAGGKMAKGLRAKLAKVIGINAQSVISRDCSDIVFLYEHYKTFAFDIDTIFPKMMEKIKGGT